MILVDTNVLSELWPNAPDLNARSYQPSRAAFCPSISMRRRPTRL
jgi:predicted nucleic acid-binding protein